LNLMNALVIILLRAHSRISRSKTCLTWYVNGCSVGIEALGVVNGVLVAAAVAIQLDILVVSSALVGTLDSLRTSKRRL